MKEISHFHPGYLVMIGLLCLAVIGLSYVNILQSQRMDVLQHNLDILAYHHSGVEINNLPVELDEVQIQSVCALSNIAVTSITKKTTNIHLVNGVYYNHPQDVQLKVLDQNGAELLLNGKLTINENNEAIFTYMTCTYAQ